VLLVAIMEELDGTVGPVGLAKQLHRDEALEHAPRDGTIVDDPPPQAGGLRHGVPRSPEAVVIAER
jgi:hypothetical protein